MSTSTEYKNRVFNPVLAPPVNGTEVGIEIRDGKCDYFNPSYENLATTEPNDRHQYEDLPHLRNQILGNRASTTGSTGPRKKRNEVYESTSDLSPLKKNSFPRKVRTDTECSEESTDVTFSKDSWMQRVILVFVLVVSLASCLLVVLLMLGKVGPSCGCNSDSTIKGATATAQKSVAFNENVIPDLESRFEAKLGELMKNFSTLQDSLAAKEKRIEQLEARLSVQEKKIANINVTTKLVKFYNVSEISGQRGPRGYNGSQGPPGPVGPKGSGDLSQCRHRELKSAPGSLRSDINVKVPQNEIMMGATCASNDEQSHNQLKYDSYNKLYECRCVTESHTLGFTCSIHYWSCPRTS